MTPGTDQPAPHYQSAGLSDAPRGVDQSLLAYACSGVAGAAQPRFIRDMPVRPGPDERPEAAVLLLRLINEGEHAETARTWMGTFGDQVTMSLMALRDVDESLASHLIGASLQAHISAGKDLATHSVLGLAEAAWAWLCGAAAVRDGKFT